MYKINTVQVPIEFGKFLKMKQHANWHQFGPIVSSKDPFHIFVRQVLSPLDQKSNVNDIIRSLGQINFRNRIANCYLNKIVNNTFISPSHSPFEHIQDILKLEEKYSKLENPMTSRCFMFFFVKKLSLLSKSENDNIDIPEKISNVILEVVRKRLEFFDWFVLMFWKFLDFYDKDDLLNIIQEHSQESYKKLIYHLSPEQKFEFYSEMLNYSYCIQETDLFFQFFAR